MRCAHALAVTHNQLSALVAVDLYEMLLKHFEQFFGVQSEQYERVLYEVVY